MNMLDTRMYIGHEHVGYTHVNSAMNITTDSDVFLKSTDGCGVAQSYAESLWPPLAMDGKKVVAAAVVPRVGKDEVLKRHRTRWPDGSLFQNWETSKIERQEFMSAAVGNLATQSWVIYCMLEVDIPNLS